MRARLSSLASVRSGGRRDQAATAARDAARDPHPTAPPERVGADTFEWRMREADGPTDRGHYACSCGFQFAAPVDTSVRCPHCGLGQAW